MSLSKYSHGRSAYTDHLAQRLNRTRARLNRAKEIDDADYSYSAANFLAKVLYASEEANPFTRSVAEQIVAAANPNVSLGDLEARSLVQFTLGKLYIPAGIRMAGFVRSEDEVGKPASSAVEPPSSDESSANVVLFPKFVPLLSTLSDDERIALRALVRAKKKHPESSLWISKSALEQIYSIHKAAHDDTPELAVLLPSAFLTPSRRNEQDGYIFSMRSLTGEGIWAPLVDRALALLWGSILRDQRFPSKHQALQVWWTTAAPVTSWSNPASQMSGPAKSEFLDACQSAILSEAGPRGTDKELERICWEFTLEQFSAEGLPVTPPPGAHLLDWYRWFDESRILDCATAPLHTDMDDLVRFVVANEPYHSATRTLELLAAAQEERPYLLSSIVRTLEGSGRSNLAAVIRNPGTSALGMKLIQDISIDESAVAEWEGWSFRERNAEKKRTQLWEDALKVFLGSPAIAAHGTDSQGIEELSRVLLMAAESSAKGSSHAPDGRTEGVERRWQVLLELLESLGDTELRRIVPALAEIFSDTSQIRSRYRPDLPVLPLAEMRILCWLLTTSVRLANEVTAEAKTIADAILDLYTTELQREITADNRVIHWLDDRPNALLLPWSDLAAILQVTGNLKTLIEPSGVSWASHFASVPQSARNVMDAGHPDHSRQLHLSWLHKLRLHLRILLSIHEELCSDVAIAPLLSPEEKNRLLDEIREQIHELTVTFTSSDPNVGRPSLFVSDFDSHYVSFRSTPAQPPLAECLIDQIRHFPPNDRDKLFEDWIEVEEDPRILLTLASSKLTPKIHELADNRLNGLNLDQFVDERRWIFELMQLAERANRIGRIQWVQRILAMGDKKLASRKHQDWEKFAFRMRLMIACHQGDAGRIENEPVPPSLAQAPMPGNADRAEVEDSRNFYLGVALHKSNPKRAYELFKKLALKDPQNPSYAINAFATRVEAALQIKVSKPRREELIRAWDEFASEGAQVPDGAAASPLYRLNRLICLDAAQLDDLFDADWANLPSERKLQTDFLSVGVANARRRGQPEKARQMIAQARPFNLTGQGSPTNEFLILESQDANQLSPKIVPTEDQHDPQVSRSQFREWINGPSHIIPLIFGEADQSIEEFLWDHLLAAAREFLLRRSIFGKLSNENDRNDAMSSLMKRSLAFLRNWSVTDQPRGGSSSTGKDAGERDWVVKDHSGELAIFEALNLGSVEAAKIDLHVEKVVFEYDPEGKRTSFVIVYFEGGNFAAFWERYLGHLRETPLRDRGKPVDDANPLENKPLENIRAVVLRYDFGGVERHVWHLAMNLGPGGDSGNDAT